MSWYTSKLKVVLGLGGVLSFYGVATLATFLVPFRNIGYMERTIFLVAFMTVAQFSFWGNYLPRVYPLHLRGTGESFAANIGGRMIGTCAALLTTTLLAAPASAAPRAAGSPTPARRRARSCPTWRRTRLP